MTEPPSLVESGLCSAIGPEAGLPWLLLLLLPTFTPYEGRSALKDLARQAGQQAGFRPQLTYKLVALSKSLSLSGPQFPPSCSFHRWCEVKLNEIMYIKGLFCAGGPARAPWFSLLALCSQPDTVPLC